MGKEQKEEGEGKKKQNGEDGFEKKMTMSIVILLEYYITL